MFVSVAALMITSSSRDDNGDSGDAGTSIRRDSDSLFEKDRGLSAASTWVRSSSRGSSMVGLEILKLSLGGAGTAPSPKFMVLVRVGEE